MQTRHSKLPFCSVQLASVRGVVQQDERSRDGAGNRCNALDNEQPVVSQQPNSDHGMAPRTISIQQPHAPHPDAQQ